MKLQEIKIANEMSELSSSPKSRQVVDFTMKVAVPAIAITVGTTMYSCKPKDNDAERRRRMAASDRDPMPTLFGRKGNRFALGDR